MNDIIYTSGKHRVAVRVDENMYDYLSGFTWWLQSSGYIYTQKIVEGKRQNILMHRLINKTTEGLDTDHINRNKLDNRKVNLRTATRSLNQVNRKVPTNNVTGVKGVQPHNSKTNPFYAIVKRNGKVYWVGAFKTIADAALARKAFIFEKGL